MNSIALQGEKAYLYPDFSFDLTKSSNKDMIGKYSDLSPVILYSFLFDYLLGHLTGETIYTPDLPDNIENLDSYVTLFLERMITLNVINSQNYLENSAILAKNREEYSERDLVNLNYSYMFYLPSISQSIHVPDDVDNLYKLADITQMFFALKGSSHISSLKDNADKLEALYVTLSQPIVPFHGHSCRITTIRFEEEKYIALSRFSEQFMANNDPHYKTSISKQLSLKQLQFSQLLMIYILARKLQISSEEYYVEKAFSLYTYDVNGNPLTVLESKPEISFCEVYRDKLIKLDNYKVKDSLAASLASYIKMKTFYEKFALWINIITPLCTIIRYLLRKKNKDSYKEQI